MPALSEIEFEACLLYAVMGILNGMLNNARISVSSNRQAACVRPIQWSDSDLVAIHLTDLLSKTDPSVLGRSTPHLRSISSVCESPLIAPAEEYGLLEASTARFREWLGEEFEYELNLGGSRPVSIRLERYRWVKFCGNSCKHAFSRLSSSLTDILEGSQVGDPSTVISPETIASNLEAIKEQLFDDVFHYHLSYICEMLNEIRHGIHMVASWGDRHFGHSEYREAHSMWVRRYHYPDGLDNRLARACFWELMISGGREPYIPRFRADHNLRQRY